MLQAPVLRPGLFFTRVSYGWILILTMQKSITAVYTFLVSVVLATAFTFRYYRLWSGLYSMLFIPSKIRKLQPPLLTDPNAALARTLLLPYNPDGRRELMDVCASPGLAESKILDIKAGKEPDLRTPNDCDDSARHVANSLDPILHPYIVSVLCIDRRDMKFKIFPKFPGHAVCVWLDLPTGGIYHMGNWNSRGDDLDAREFEFRTFDNLAKDLCDKMTANEGDILAWLVMDPYLRTCAWGMGTPPDWNAIEFSGLKPLSIIG